MQRKLITKTWMHLLLLTTLVLFVNSNQLECQVLVQGPWPIQYLAVPLGSSVELNCTANLGNDVFWAIDLGNDSTPVQYQFGPRGTEMLNNHGVYELPRIEMPGMMTLRLLINESAVNNQTNVVCYNINEETELSTTLLMFNQSQLDTSIQDVRPGTINITWDPVAVDVMQIFTLEINHSSTLTVSESLNESYYYFTAPEGAPPCEVYSISVTATYAGATYIGPSCSVSSPVLSMMLPSLPDIDGLERSLKHSIVQLTQEIILNVSFEPASECEQYPVTYYTLEIGGPLPETTMQSYIVEDLTAMNTILENAEYNFTIVVSNSIGNVSTKSRTFYSTDVQMVEVTLMEGSQDASIQCEFIVGSKATGCLVVLTSKQGQEDYRLMRNTMTNLATLRVTLRHVVSSYLEVEAFDIEYDGSVGSLAVPGILHVSPEIPENMARSLFVLKQSRIILNFFAFIVLIML